MKKSIFMGNFRNNVINKVYSDKVRAILEEEAGLIGETVIGKEMLEEYCKEVKDVNYIFSTWGMPNLSEKEIEKYFPKLEAVFYAAGSVQSFARPFLEKNIKVFSAWAANAVPVAEYTVSQIILANKGFFQGAFYMSGGDVERARKHCADCTGNYGCKVGIIGAGMIGTMVIRKLKSSYNMDVYVFDAFMSEKKAKELGVRSCSAEELFTVCDVISNHLADKPETVGILNGNLFERMKPNVTFINTGRGAQVVEKDLISFLKRNTSATAVLDVTMPEPPEKGHEFYSLKNVFLTPHIAGSMGNERERMGDYMLEEFRGLQKGSTRFEVTPDMLETMA